LQVKQVAVLAHGRQLVSHPVARLLQPCVGLAQTGDLALQTSGFISYGLQPELVALQLVAELLALDALRLPQPL
jgi:hypothetical protein